MTRYSLSGEVTALGWKFINVECAAKKITILNKDAEVDAKDTNGWTALMRASFKGYSEPVIALIKKGADVNARSNTDASSEGTQGS